MARNADGSPSESTATSGIFVETVLSEEEDNEDQGTIQDEQLSEASSVGSIPFGADDVSPGDLTDMTAPSKCRVYMTRMESGQRIYSCCGNDRSTCPQRGHQAKEEVRRGPPCWYEAFPNSRGRHCSIHVVLQGGHSLLKGHHAIAN